MERLIPGFVLLVIGGLYAVRPDLMIRFQVWTQKVILGATYIPSSRTYKITRGLGVVLVILGLLVITGIIK
jgi:hypothetical protein